MAALWWLEERDSLELNVKELPVVTPFFQFWLYSCTCWSFWLKLLSGEAHRLHIRHIHTISFVESNMMNVFIKVPFESSWGRRTCWLTTEKENPTKIYQRTISFLPKTNMIGRENSNHEWMSRCISYTLGTHVFFKVGQWKVFWTWVVAMVSCWRHRGRPWISSNLWTLMVQKSGKLTSWY